MKLAPYYRNLVINICTCVSSYRAYKTGIFKLGDMPIKSTIGIVSNYLTKGAGIA